VQKLVKKTEGILGIRSNIELKNVNPNGDNVVASNLNNVNLFFFFTNYEK
jgi:hypothetical protein